MSKHEKLILIGMSIRLFRLSEEYTVETFAVETGLNRNHLTDIEIGVVNIGFDTLEKICSTLEISISELIASGEE